MGKSKGKKKRTTPNNQNQISLIIEIIKLITAIISLIRHSSYILKGNWLILSHSLPISIICKKEAENNGKKDF